MKILLKSTFKNIIHKPLRSLLVIGCVSVCALAAMLCFDMSSAVRNALRNMLGSMLGKMDVEAVGNNLEDFNYDDPKIPAFEYAEVYRTGASFYRRVDDEYNYIHCDELFIAGLDMERGKKMEVVPNGLDLKDDECLLTKQFADLYGYGEGDTIEIPDQALNPVEYKVAKVYDFEGKGFIGEMGAMMTVEGVRKLNVSGHISPQVLLIDILDDGKITDATSYLKDTYPNYSFISLFDMEEIKTIMDILTAVFFLLFAICFLMVIFVSVSISERIICERMSVVGTFRSLGISNGTTAFIVLIENTIYALIGAAIGCGLYAMLRSVVLGGIVTTGETGVTIDFGKVNPMLYLAVFLVSILIECLIPVRELLKAIRTPIRDIIFDNKDTKYNIKIVSVIIGGIFAVTAIVLAFVPKTFVTGIIIMVSIVMAVFLLYPIYVKGLCILAGKLFDKWNKPVASMALNQVYTKKSNIGAGRLIVTAGALAIVIFSFSLSMLEDLGKNTLFDADILVTTNADTEDFYFSYIERMPEVSYVEEVYMGSLRTTLNDSKEYNLFVLAQTAAEESKFLAMGDCPAEIADDEIVIDSSLAKKNNLQVGDIVEVVFEPSGYAPVKVNLKVKALFKGNMIDPTGNAIVVSKKILTDAYGDAPFYILVNSSDPDLTAGQIRKYSAEYIQMVQTNEEYCKQQESGSYLLLVMLYLAIGMGVGLTVIGATSNLLIGFEARKRECAVLCSTAMSRNKVAVMLYLESLFASLFSLIVAVPAGILMMKAVVFAIESLNTEMSFTIQPLLYIICAVVLVLAFSLTALLPIFKLKRMNLAEQLKYE